jgi:hypothetical protein
MAEDNLAKLYKGNVVGTDPELERVYARKKPTGPLQHPMVMLYPREGSTAHTHPAAVLRAWWVSNAQAEGARKWIDFLREDTQQAAFMDEGFRPAAGRAVPLRCPICGQYGIDPKGPRATINPSTIPPGVAQRIVESWGDVKNPGVVIFVVDTSTAMAGEKISAAREGIIKAIDGMYRRNLVGLLTSSSEAGRVEPVPVVESLPRVWEALERMRAGGPSPLYGTVLEAVTLADSAPAEPSAIRGVVVLAGGRVTTGAPLHDLVRMASRGGRAVPRCPGMIADGACPDEDGRAIPREEIMGLQLAVPTEHPVRIYYIGIGDNADLEAGRILAEATGSNFLGIGVEDLDIVVRLFSQYF